MSRVNYPRIGFFLIYLLLFINSLTLAYDYPVVVDLGAYGFQNNESLAINDLGQVIGLGDQEALLYDHGNITHISGFESVSGSWPVIAINNNTQIAGLMDGGFVHIWENGTAIKLAVQPNTTLTVASSINNSAVVAGWTYRSVGIPYTACVWENDNVTDLGSPDGSSVANGINDLGQVVGSYGDGYAYLYETGVWTFLNNWTPANQGWDASRNAWDINNNGKIAGSAYKDSVLHACVWDNGTITDLGVGEAFAINDLGQAVGIGPGYGILYDNGITYNLNDLVDPGLGWTLGVAYDINNSGWIVGLGTNPSGQNSAYLLIPEPTSLTILALGGLCFLRRVHKR